MVPERERQDREQMNMIYSTIISQGLAKEDQVVFVRGRGRALNFSVMNDFLATGFKMYGPYSQPSQPGPYIQPCQPFVIQGPDAAATFSKAPSSNDNGNIL